MGWPCGFRQGVGWVTGWTGGTDVFVGRMSGIVGGTFVLLEIGWVGRGRAVEAAPGMGVRGVAVSMK